MREARQKYIKLLKLYDENLIGDDGERLDGLDDLTEGQWSDLINDVLEF